jgi:hypothetical protein
MPKKILLKNKPYLRKDLLSYYEVSYKVLDKWFKLHDIQIHGRLMPPAKIEEIISKIGGELLDDNPGS